MLTDALMDGLNPNAPICSRDTLSSFFGQDTRSAPQKFLLLIIFIMMMSDGTAQCHMHTSHCLVTWAGQLVTLSVSIAFLLTTQGYLVYFCKTDSLLLPGFHLSKKF